MAESINLEPDWEGMRRWVLHVAETDPEQAALIAGEMGSEAPPMCEWFAGCNRVATTTRRGPTPNGPSMYGDVPICARCDARIESLS